MNLNQTNVSNELATAPVGKLLFKLAVPTVIAQFVNLLYNIGGPNLHRPYAREPEAPL